MATDSELRRVIRALLDVGMDPNGIEDAFDAALEVEAVDWAKWGDDRWRTDTVCAKCGSSLAGVCGGPTAEKPWGSPCTTERPMLRREFLARQAKESQS